MSVIKATKKPVTIDALVWDKSGRSQKEISKFLPQEITILDYSDCGTCECPELYDCGTCECPELYIKTLEGNMHVSVGDFVIKGVNGEFYPCKPDIFNKTYDIED